MFDRSVKRLAKRYPSMRADIAELIDELAHAPVQGTALGKDCYKVRIAIRSKGKGRSGGARVITCVKVVHHTVILLTIYDKSDTDNISDKELKKLVEMFA